MCHDLPGSESVILFVGFGHHFANNSVSVYAAYHMLPSALAHSPTDTGTAPLSPLSAQLESDKQEYFAKYLTSQKLLQLQLSDSMFRRFVLMQFLILFQYLTSTVKFKR